VKYAKEIFSNFTADFGAGISCSYASIECEESISSYYKQHENDWLFGGQVFADLTYNIQGLPFTRFIKFISPDDLPSIGVNAKYQMTQDFKDRNVDFTNWRLGAQLSWLIGIDYASPPPVIPAKQKAPLGGVNLAVKADLINFTDHFFQLIDEEHRPYTGIVGYGKIYKNVYIGGEFGYCSVSNDFQNDDLLHQHRAYDADLTFWELNAKYAKNLSPYIVISAGGGFCWIKIDGAFEVRNFILVDDQYMQTVDKRVPEADWLFGGQIFTDLTFKYHWIQLGINAKYQMTQEMKNEGGNFDLNNYRLGGHLGVLF
jgi:hypothetical protein